MTLRNALLATAGAAALGLAAAGAADAQTFAQATTDLNLRAGPGMDQPVIAVMPAGASVEIHQCLEGRVWCEVTYAGTTGWASERFLTAELAVAPDAPIGIPGPAPEPGQIEPRPDAERGTVQHAPADVAPTY
jgi:uncharacterized protein YraI